MPRRKPQDAGEEDRGMGVGASPQAPTQTPTEGEQRQEPLFYVITVKVKIDADNPQAKVIKERLGRIIDLEFALDDTRGLLNRFESTVSKAMPKPLADKIQDKLAEVEKLLQEAKKELFETLAETGEIDSIDVSEEW